MKQKTLNRQIQGLLLYKYYLKLLYVEHILVHPVERLFNAGAG